MKRLFRKLSGAKGAENTRLPQKGFAMVIPLIFTAVFFVIAAGGALSVLNYHKALLTAAEQGHVNAATVALMTRAAENLSDYVNVHSDFPPSDQVAVIKGNTLNWFCGNSGSCEDVSTHGTGESAGQFEKNFTAFLGALPPGSSMDYLSGYPSGLTIAPIDGTALDEKKFNVSAWVKGQSTEAYANFNQTITIKKGQLFKYFSFYDLPLEIISGSNLTIDGPLFSNSDVYVFPSSSPTQSITFTGFVPPSADPVALAAFEHVPFLLQSAKMIWFYYQRFVGELFKDKDGLDISLWPNKSVDYFRREMVKRGQCADKADWTQICSGPDEGIEIMGYAVPKYYWAVANNWFNNFGNDTTYVSLVGNNWVVDDKFGNPFSLSPPHPLGGNYIYPQYGYYARYNVSLTEIFNKDLFSSDIRLGAGVTSSSLWSPVNPNFSDIISSHFKGHYAGSDYYVMGDHPTAGIGRKTISVGVPDTVSIQNRNHIIIEPILEGVDSDSVKQAKMQFKANINIDYRVTEPSDFRNPNKYNGPNGFLKQVAKTSTSPPCAVDLRCTPNDQTNVKYNLCEIDVAKLMANIDSQSIMNYKESPPAPLSPSSQVILYINGVNASGQNQCEIVRLVHAAKLPEKGFTIATPHRVQIQADFELPMDLAESGYNIYDYGSTSAGRPAGYCSIENDKIMNKNGATPVDCVLPPAAVISDSAVIISADYTDFPLSDWKNPADGSNFNFSNYQDHRVQKDKTMIVTAIVTGHIPSALFSPRGENDWPKPSYDSSTPPQVTSGVGSFNFGFSGWAKGYPPYNAPSPTPGWKTPSSLVEFDAAGGFYYIDLAKLRDNLNLTIGDSGYPVPGNCGNYCGQIEQYNPTVAWTADGCSRDTRCSVQTGDQKCVAECNAIPIGTSANGMVPALTGKTISSLDPSIWGSGCDPLNPNHAKIPVLLKMNRDYYVTSEPVTVNNPVADGVLFAYLASDYLFGWGNCSETVSSLTECDASCPRECVCPACSDGVCGAAECAPDSPRKCPVSTPGGTTSCLRRVPKIRYMPYYYQLFNEPQYSGGLPNLVEAIEDWREYNHYEIGSQGTSKCTGVETSGCIPIPTNNSKKLYLKGALSSLWEAASLRKPNDSTKKCYWTMDSYAAPERHFLYNKDLVGTPPPGAPAVNETVFGDFEDGERPS